MADWFRSPDWSDDAQQDFELRLSRARPGGRAQYLRIKALALEESGQTEAASTLLHRIIEDYPDAWTEVAFAHERLGDLCVAADNPAGAETEYREVLAVSPTLSGTTGEVHVKLGEVLLQTGGSISEIERLLTEAKSHVTFNSTAFRVNVLTARVAAATGDVDRRCRAASAALDLVEAAPPFQRHPTVGLVQATPLLLSELREMAERVTDDLIGAASAGITRVAEQIPMVAGHVRKDRDTAVRLVSWFGHEHDAVVEHAHAGILEVVDAEEESDAAGVLRADDRLLPVSIGLCEQQAGGGAGRSDDDPALGSTVVRDGR